MGIYITKYGQTIFDIAITIFNNYNSLIMLCQLNNLNPTSFIPSGTHILYNNTYTPSVDYVSNIFE